MKTFVYCNWSDDERPLPEEGFPFPKLSPAGERLFELTTKLDKDLPDSIIPPVFKEVEAFAREFGLVDFEYRRLTSRDVVFFFCRDDKAGVVYKLAYWTSGDFVSNDELLKLAKQNFIRDKRVFFLETKAKIKFFLKNEDLIAENYLFTGTNYYIF